MKYAFFDGDDIGKTIEILLIENRVHEATQLSKNINVAANKLQQTLQTKNDVEVIILGGDDVLIRYNPEQYDSSLLLEIISIFENMTGLAMSCGVGNSITAAIHNLHLAKLYGKNQIKGID